MVGRRSKWIAWLAGIIDGEGSLDFSWRKKPYNYLDARLTVSNTDFRIPLKCKEITQVGFVYYLKSKNPKRKDWACWAVKGENAMKVIEITYPSLISKQEQAKTFLKWRKLKRLGGSGFGHCHKVPNRVIKQREELCKQRIELRDELMAERHRRNNNQIQKREEKNYGNKN